MAIEINDYYRSQISQEADKVASYADQISRWRRDHSGEVDASKLRDLSRLYDKLEEHTRELKRALEGYYEGINL